MKKNKLKQQKIKCNQCKINDSYFVRKFISKNVPNKYILEYDSSCAQLLRIYYKFDYFKDREQFINLPKSLIMTKYNYYLCKKCFEKYTSDINNIQEFPWNIWHRI